MKNDSIIIQNLRQELKEQIDENQELNDGVTWWKNRYEAQVKINEEHQKLNGELRKEIDGLTTVIDLAKEYIKEYGRDKQLEEEYLMNAYNLAVYNTTLLEILDKANESEVN